MFMRNDCIKYLYCINIDDTHITTLAANSLTIVSFGVRAGYLVEELHDRPRRATAHHSCGQVRVAYAAGQHPCPSDVDVSEVNFVDEFLREGKTK